MLGLKNYEDMGIKLLCVKGDIELIDELVKGYNFRSKKIIYDIIEIEFGTRLIGLKSSTS